MCSYQATLLYAHRNRKENLDRARAHEVAGNTAAAYDSYQKAVDITPEVAARFVQVKWHPLG